MSEEGFWIILWTIAATTILGIGLLIGNYYSTQNRIIENLIKEGHNPIAVVCAMDNGNDKYSSNSICVLYVTGLTNGDN